MTRIDDPYIVKTVCPICGTIIYHNYWEEPYCQVCEWCPPSLIRE